MLARLAERERAQRIRADIARDGLNNWGRIPSWDCVTISISPHLPQHAGRTIAALAAESGADPIDALCDYLIADRGATRVLVASIAEDDIRTLVASPHALVGSDGNCVAPYGIVGQGLPHPRFYGTFPRVLSRYVREQNAAAACRRHPQNDRRNCACAQAQRPRPVARRLLRRYRHLRSGRFYRSRHLRASRTGSRPARARMSSSTARSVVENAAHTGALPGKVLRRDRTGAVG